MSNPNPYDRGPFPIYNMQAHAARLREAVELLDPQRSRESHEQGISDVLEIADHLEAIHLPSGE